MLKRDNEAKTEDVRNLKMQLQDIEHQRLELLESQDKLARHYEMRVIDSKGDYIPYKPDEPGKMD